MNIIEKIRPYLNMDGGDLEFIKYEDNYIYVRLIGNCADCLDQDTTINNLLFDFFKNEITDLEGVINVSF